MKTVYSVCGMCGTRCPVAVGVENGEAVWIQGNPHSATVRHCVLAASRRSRWKRIPSARSRP